MDTAWGWAATLRTHGAPSPTLGGSWSNRTTGRQGKKEPFLGFRKSGIFTSPSQEQGGAPSAPSPIPLEPQRLRMRL